MSERSSSEARAPRKPKIANFDSATAMLRALAGHLNDRDFIALGSFPHWATGLMSAVGGTVNRLPAAARNAVYSVSGWTEAVAQRHLVSRRTDPAQVARWLCSHYPKRSYSAVMLGSSNGALMHVAAACGIPWLPQTYLMPVAHRRLDPNDPERELKVMRGLGERFVDAYHDVQLHHMHDPSQDRLMVQLMSYFRVKYLKLPEAYKRFITQSLPAGGTICVIDCRLTWPTTRLRDRYLFQFGAPGGVAVDEYLEGSGRVAAFLEERGDAVRRWRPPRADTCSPEAEWGFEATLLSDIEAFAAANGYRTEILSFPAPEDMSPLVADLYRAWYRDHGVAADRLLAESFILLDPHRAWRAGLVPFWTFFNMMPSLRALEAYLKGRAAFDEIGIMLFSHGVRSVGLAGIEQWNRCLALARRSGFYVGVDTRAYPQDFATFVNYSRDLERRYGMTNLDIPAMSYEHARDFLRSQGEASDVTWRLSRRRSAA